MEEEEADPQQNLSRREVEEDLGLSMLIDSQNNQYILTRPRDATIPRADHHLIKVAWPPAPPPVIGFTCSGSVVVRHPRERAAAPPRMLGRRREPHPTSLPPSPLQGRQGAVPHGRRPPFPR